MKSKSTSNTLIRMTVLLLCLCLLPIALSPAWADSAPLNLLLEDTDIGSMAAVGDTLYGLTGSGLYTVSKDTGDMALVSENIHTKWTQEGGIDNADVLLSDGEKLYALNSDSKELFEVKTRGASAELVRLAVVEDYAPEGYPQQIFIEDGCLVWLEPQGIAAYAFDSGETRRVEASSLRLIAPYRDGQWAALTQDRTSDGIRNRLLSIDPATGKSTELADFPAEGYWYSLGYRPQDQSLLIFDRSSVHAWREREALRELSFYPAGDFVGFALVGQDAVAVRVDNLLSVRSLDTETAITRLSLLELYGHGENYVGFMKARPDVALYFHPLGAETPEEAFVQDMLTRSSEVDIYLLSDLNLLDTIRRKGYALDMAQNESVKAAVAGMHRPFREAMSSGEQIIAFPKEVFLDMFSYNRPVFEALGLKAPETYEEYLDFCLDWIENRADDEANYGLEPFSNGMDMMSLLRNYANELSKAGKPLVFSTDIMRNIIGKYMVIHALGHAGERESQPLFYLYMIPMTAGGFDYLPLRFDKANDFVKGIGPDEFSYFVINPYTKNPEAALSFIQNYTRSIDTMYRLVLEERTQAIIDPGYEQVLSAMTCELTLLEESAAKAQGAERRELEGQIKKAREDIDYFEENGKWAITQDEIDTYLAMADSVYIAPYNPISVLAEENPDMFEEWRSNPNFNIDQFLDRLDNMVQKAMAERD